MQPDISLWSFIINAGFVVKVVMFILVLASVASWMIIIQRVLLFKDKWQSARSFEQNFWSGANLNELYEELQANKDNLSGLRAIFYAGFKEFKLLSSPTNAQMDQVLEGTQRAMAISHAREVQSIKTNLSFLATVGSTSPYVGLFGTVWGIMTAFRALGAVQQATISMVAPGISEALIATAFGLFAAIPAVIAYNRFTNNLDRLQEHYEIFQEELVSLMQRKMGARQNI